MTRHAQRTARTARPAVVAGLVAAVLAAGGATLALAGAPGWPAGPASARPGAAAPGPADPGTATPVPLTGDAPATGAVVPGWTAVRAGALDRLAAAAQLLDATAGQVDDDAVRAAVDQAAGTLRAALERADAPADAPGPAAAPGTGAPPPGALADVGTASAALALATASLGQAHEGWLAARAAQDEASRAAAAAAQRWVGTTDCGVPGPEGLPERDASSTLYTSVPDEAGDGSNGRLPRSAMRPLAWCTDSQGHQQWLRADAATALAALNDAFRARFGENIAVDLSYRSYDDQVRAKEIFGDLAATPGTSNHGLGTAIDTWESDYYAFGSERFTWLVEHGPEHGWVCPAATQRGNPEYWHFEYRG